MKKYRKQEECKQMKCDKIRKKHKRKIIIESSSDQDEEWQPSEQNNSSDDSEYLGSAGSKQKISRTKEKPDNGEKHRFEAQQSTMKGKLPTKKEIIDNSKNYDFAPKQSTNTQSTFLMNVQKQALKKDKPKKSLKIKRVRTTKETKEDRTSRSRHTKTYIHGNDPDTERK